MDYCLSYATLSDFDFDTLVSADFASLPSVCVWDDPWLLAAVVLWRVGQDEGDVFHSYLAGGGFTATQAGDGFHPYSAGQVNAAGVVAGGVNAS